LYTPNSTLEPFPVIVALLWIRICFPSWTIYIIRGDAKEKKKPRSILRVAATLVIRSARPARYDITL
jgi:hypothetical protein